MTNLSTERIKITPRVKILTTLRNSGYDNNSAIGDIVDNSIDAGAKNIWIDIVSKHEISVSDDATGMSEERLVEAMALGSETDKNSGTTLGRFGFGMKTASLSLGRCLTVITKQPNSGIVTAVHDLDVMNKEQDIFVDVHRCKAGEKFSKSFSARTRGSNKGTVVVISSIDSLSNPNIATYRTNLKTYIAEVFRNFINNGVNIFINGIKIEATDIILLKHGGEVYSDREYKLPYIDDSGKQKSTIVRIRLFLLPNFTKTNNKNLGINQLHQGLYIMRNDRQIIRANMQWSGMVKSASYNRFRGEIYFKGELDKTVGIDFQKTTTSNVRESFKSRIQAIIKPGFDAILGIIRNQAMNALVEDEEREEQYQKIDEDINTHFDEVTKIKPEVIKNVQSDLEEKAAKESKDEKEEKPNPISRKSKNKRLIETSNARMGADGVICDYEFKSDGVLRLVWNVDHKFYSDFLANRDFETVGVIVKLFAANARTQASLLMNNDDERAKIEEYNQIVSEELNLFMSDPRKKRGLTHNASDVE